MAIHKRVINEGYQIINQGYHLEALNISRFRNAFIHNEKSKNSRIYFDQIILILCLFVTILQYARLLWHLAQRQDCNLLFKFKSHVCEIKYPLRLEDLFFYTAFIQLLYTIYSCENVLISQIHLTQRDVLCSLWNSQHNERVDKNCLNT